MNKFYYFLIIFLMCYKLNLTTSDNFYSKIHNEELHNLKFGKNATIYEFPCITSIRLWFRYETFCTGCIISDVLILTSGQCLQFAKKPKAMTVSACDISINKPSLSIWRSGQIRRVRRYIKHPKYDPYNRQFDVGLIEVDEPFEFCDICHPVQIKRVNQYVNNYDKMYCKIAGWGVHQKDHKIGSLRKIDLLINNNSKINKCIQHSPSFNLLTQICGTSKDDNSSSELCIADTGSPVFCDNEFIGIFSISLRRVDASCSKVNGVVLTTLANIDINDWIHENKERGYLISRAQRKITKFTNYKIFFLILAIKSEIDIFIRIQ